MSYAVPSHRDTPRGLAKLFALNWALILLLCAVAGAGFLMLYSNAGGSFSPWAGPQMIRFGVGLVAMVVIAMVPLRFWRWVAPFAYLGAFALLVLVEIMGSIGMGAQRWIDLGPIQLQPSELMKVTLVMALAAYPVLRSFFDGFAGTFDDATRNPGFGPGFLLFCLRPSGYLGILRG